jgi:hypothetical protein
MLMKLKTVTTILFLFLLHLSSFSQDLAVSLIPDSLKQNAHLVIREFQTEIILSSSNSGKEFIMKAVTVLDREGEKNAVLLLPYDKNSVATVKDITIFDATGKKIKSVKQSEIEDYPAFSSFELFSEDRIKYYKPTVAELPYTIVYEYGYSHNNMISLGRWMPLNNYNLSVQHAAISLNYPAGVKINRKEISLKRTSRGEQKNSVTEVWELSGMKAIESEPFSLPVSELVPSLCLMPSYLDFDGYKGKADNWNQYGRWAFSLYRGRDILDDAGKLKLLILERELKTAEDKIAVLYKYLQDNTRYVAVTLGIGGYQPIDAATVFRTGYGDCKALANFMYTLLKNEGIESFPALVSAGKYRSEIYSDFPNFSQFNHVILCVPLKGDTLWLECTDQKIPMGFLGSFTCDREVLLLTEEGGRFAHTPVYGEADNTRHSTCTYSIDASGSATFSSRIRSSGLQYDDLTGLIEANAEDQKKWLYENSDYPSMQIRSFSVSQKKGRLPVAEIDLSAVSNGFCTFSGDYMVMPLNLENTQSAARKMIRPRKSDIVIRESFTDQDTLVYRLPAGYAPLSPPKNVNLSSRFGEYSFSVSLAGDQLTCTRRFILKGGKYPSAYYKEMYDFILAVSKSDNARVLLSKKP